MLIWIHCMYSIPQGFPKLTKSCSHFPRYYWLVVTLKTGCIGMYGKNWLLNAGTSSQSEGYSSKSLIWLVCGEPLYLPMTIAEILYENYLTFIKSLFQTVDAWEWSTDAIDSLTLDPYGNGIQNKDISVSLPTQKSLVDPSRVLPCSTDTFYNKFSTAIYV